MRSSPRPRHRASTRLGAFALAAAIALVPARSEAIAPALLFVLKQIAQDMAKSMLKDALVSGLAGMGCKGIALASALEALDLRRGIGNIGGAGAMLGLAGGGSAKIGLGAAAMPSGMPNLSAMAGMPALPSLAGMPALGSVSGLAGGGGASAELAARMHRLMPDAGQIPAGAGLGPDQLATMTRMLQSMSEPLSPVQTVATIGELSELGFLPKAVQTELKECMLVLPASIPALGMGMAMLKPIVPQLRQAREQMRSLSPAEQDEVAAALAAEIAPLPKEQRAEFIEHLGSGFFPPRVSDGVKQRLAVK